MVNIPVLAFGTVRKYKQMLPFITQGEQAPESMMRGMRSVLRGVNQLVESAGVPAPATSRSGSQPEPYIR